MQYHRFFIAAVAVMAIATVAGRADDEEFWSSGERRAAASAAQLVAVGDPLALAALRTAGHDNDLWDEPPLVLDRVPPLSPARLDSVEDDKPFAHHDRAIPEDVPAKVRDEDAVYWQAVRNAALIPADVFTRAAEKNRHLTFGHLYENPRRYRGEVVAFDGRLVRLKRLDPPHHAQRRGIRALYEAWVYLDQPGSHPVCVVMPHKPDGIDEGDNLNHRVSVAGYFFKRYRYISGRLDAAGNNVALNTVLLIAPTCLAIGPAPTRGTSLGGGPLWPWAVGFGGVVVAFMIGMTWWFRRNDRLVQARLQAVRANPFPEGGGEPTVGANGATHTNGPTASGV
jgi:hypothetical protein